MRENHQANGNGLVDLGKLEKTTFKKLESRHQDFLIWKAPWLATADAINIVMLEFVDVFPEFKDVSFKRFASWVFCAKTHRRVALSGKKHKRQLQPMARAKKDQRY